MALYYASFCVNNHYAEMAHFYKKIMPLLGRELASDDGSFCVFGPPGGRADFFLYDEQPSTPRSREETARWLMRETQVGFMVLTSEHVDVWYANAM